MNLSTGSIMTSAIVDITRCRSCLPAQPRCFDGVVALLLLILLPPGYPMMRVMLLKFRGGARESGQARLDESLYMSRLWRRRSRSSSGIHLDGNRHHDRLCWNKYTLLPIV